MWNTYLEHAIAATVVFVCLPVAQRSRDKQQEDESVISSVSVCKQHQACSSHTACLPAWELLFITLQLLAGG